MSLLSLTTRLRLSTLTLPFTRAAACVADRAAADDPGLPGLFESAVHEEPLYVRLHAVPPHHLAVHPRPLAHQLRARRHRQQALQGQGGSPSAGRHRAGTRKSVSCLWRLFDGCLPSGSFVPSCSQWWVMCVLQ